MDAMQEHHIRVSKTARYVVLGDTTGADELWFVIHGYAQLASRFLKRFQNLERDRICVVAPEALNRYYFETAPGVHAHDAGIGATWMTREEREIEIDDYVAYLDTLYDHITSQMQSAPKRVVVLGFSQGSATASRWVIRGRVRPTDLVLWGGFVPPEATLAPDLFKRAALMFVHGSLESYATSAKVAEEIQRLKSAGLESRDIEFEGGHEVNAAGLHALVTALG